MWGESIFFIRSTDVEKADKLAGILTLLLACVCMARMKRPVCQGRCASGCAFTLTVPLQSCSEYRHGWCLWVCLYTFWGERLLSLCVWTLDVTTEQIMGSALQLTHCASLGLITESLCASISICKMSQMPTIHKSLSDFQMRCCVSVEQH